MPFKPYVLTEVVFTSLQFINRDHIFQAQMLIATFLIYQSAVVAAVAGHQAVAQDQDLVSPPAVAANQEVPNPEEVPKRAAVHVVHLDAAKLEDTPSSRHPDSL